MIDQQTNTKAEIFSDMFQFQAGIYQNALVDLTEALALKRPSDQSNHSNWLIGHILHCRFMLANMLGVKAENPLQDTYWVAINDGDYPSLDTIVPHFPGISEKLIQKISGLSDAELDAQPEEEKPSLGAMISFFTYHEAYHLGQLGYIRKLIGLGPMKSH